MRSPLGYPPLIGPAQSNDRRASGGGLARLEQIPVDIGHRVYPAWRK
jgi:hypothetical protein